MKIGKGSGMSELKTCPFCGAKAHKWRTNHRVYIECEHYDAREHQVEVSGTTDEEAEDAWNRRNGDE